jgi:hypothetical protein
LNKLIKELIMSENNSNEDPSGGNEDAKWLDRADEARAEGHATQDQVDALVAKLSVEADASKDSTTE